MNLRTPAIAVIGIAVLATAAAGLAQQTTPSGPVPPPPPYPATAPTLPGASVPIIPPTSSPPPAAGRAPAPGASETPPPPQFTNLSGVWEVQEQPGGATTIYTHLRIQQNADGTITGYWERGKELLPFNGNFDGRQFKITVQGSKAPMTLAGYEDNFSDMVGLIDMGNGKPPIAFTASHRAKTEFFSNIGIGAGGLGAPIQAPGSGTQLPGAPPAP